MRRAFVPGLSCILSQADLYQQRLPDGMQTDEIAEPRVRLEVIVAGPFLQYELNPLHFLAEVPKVGTRDTVEHENVLYRAVLSHRLPIWTVNGNNRLIKLDFFAVSTSIIFSCGHSSVSPLSAWRYPLLNDSSLLIIPMSLQV